MVLVYFGVVVGLFCFVFVLVHFIPRKPSLASKQHCRLCLGEVPKISLRFPVKLKMKIFSSGAKRGKGGGNKQKLVLPAKALQKKVF